MFFKKKPKEQTEVICDLDAILSKTVAFKYNGKIYEIPPLTFQEFIRATNALAEIDILRKKEGLDEAQVLSAYDKIFSIVCPSFDRVILNTMGNQQIAALFNLVIEVIMGKATLEVEKKNTATPMVPQNHQNLAASPA